MTQYVCSIKSSLVFYFPLVSLLLLVLTAVHAYAQNSTVTQSDEQARYRMPAVPFPEQNPPGEAKRLLGKILFWDEQLSTDNSIACGSCHMPEYGGSDIRLGILAGYDKQLGGKDDIWGSPGVIKRNSLGRAVVPSEQADLDLSSPHSNQSALTKLIPQVTGRSSPSNFASLWSASQFWDGRATTDFIDPQTQKLMIRAGGGLEHQALGPLMSDIEMAKANRTWQELTEKLSVSQPLILATHLPKDIQAQLAHAATYPSLFKQAFGDEEITAWRIAFALANYQRSLIADQTPWDRAMLDSKDPAYQALGYEENLGWLVFEQKKCASCHIPPLFTDNKFHNIGIQGQNADQGHKAVSGQAKDLGAMKTPSLRNVSLKTRFMHTGRFTSLGDVIDAYADVPFADIATRLPDGEKYDFNFNESQRRWLLAFLTQSLTDERVKLAQAPFDRPLLRTENTERQVPLAVSKLAAKVEKNTVNLTWLPINSSVMDFEIWRSDGKRFWTTNFYLADQNLPSLKSYSYQVYARNSAMAYAPAAEIDIELKSHRLSLMSLIVAGLGMVLCIALLCIFVLRRRKR